MPSKMCERAISKISKLSHQYAIRSDIHPMNMYHEIAINGWERALIAEDRVKALEGTLRKLDDELGGLSGTKISNTLLAEIRNLLPKDSL